MLAAVPGIVLLGVMRLLVKGDAENVAIEMNRSLKIGHTQGNEYQSAICHGVCDATQGTTLRRPAAICARPRTAWVLAMLQGSTTPKQEPAALCCRTALLLGGNPFDVPSHDCTQLMGA